MVKPLGKTKVVASDIVGELKKVTWPNKQDTIRLTFIVIIISLIIGLYIGIIDSLLAYALDYLTTQR